MDPHDPGLLPAPFGLANPGTLCYLNSLVQALAGCTALTRAVLESAAYLRRTRTGAALLEFVWGYAALGPGGPAALVPGAAAPPGTARVLAALVADLGQRRPRVAFGAGQQSASEALALLLDMAEPEAAAAADARPLAVPPGGAAARSVESPVTRLFLHRFRADTLCWGCRRVVSRTTDHAVVLGLFHLDALPAAPATPAEFAAAVCRQALPTEDYLCEACGRRAGATRVFSLAMVPEVLVCAFDAYTAKRARYFPTRLEIPAAAGGALVFGLVAQVEHAGSLGGGHYWATALRAGGVFQLNDTSVAPSAFGPSAETYLLFYAYGGVA